MICALTGPGPRFEAPRPPAEAPRSRKGTTGVSTNGVAASFMFFDTGTFWVLPLTYFYVPKSARVYFFSICQNSLPLQRPHSC